MPSHHFARRSGRAAAVIALALAAVMAVATAQIEYAFSSDPLGPRAFPYLLAGILALCAAWYFWSPGGAEAWPTGATLARSLLLIGVTCGAVALMNDIGFIASATAMCAMGAWLFGARPASAVAIGLVQAVFWYGLFKYGLGTYLPSGTLLFPG